MSEKRSLTPISGADRGFMSLAIDLAEKAKGSTFPNPCVGAVVVRNGTVVGKGATSVYGGPHAEIIAMEQAGVRSNGATLYVTLEPCCHSGRTGPCTDAIIRAGIRCVYASVVDPNPVVNGKGIRQLRNNGVRVITGLLDREAMNVNEDFFFWITRKKPWVSVKLALTLDGRIADSSGESKWITSPEARKYAHGIRARHAAIAVGAETLRKDNPKLTVRYGNNGKPVRFVFTSRETLPAGSYFESSAGMTARRQRSVCVVSGGPRSKQTLAGGMELWHTGTRNKTESLHTFLSMAGEEDICSILIEGGGKLASSFLESGLANRLYLFYGSKIIGGGVPGIEFVKELSLRDAIGLRSMDVRVFDRDILVTGIPVWR
jgi:diaminohydroxyphosphoribosylaminopyrimidine deaminase / 5-amino-6-(5-phosphoribosylamino)uracil reductase